MPLAPRSLVRVAIISWKKLTVKIYNTKEMSLGYWQNRTHQVVPYYTSSSSLLRSALEPSAQEGHGTVGAGPKEGYKNDPRGWSTSPMRTGWESWGCSAWRRGGCRETLLQPSSTWRGPARKPESDFLQEHVVIGQGVMASSWKSIGLD